MRYVYKKLAVCNMVLLYGMFIHIQIAYTSEPQPATTTDDKTMAVLNEMLATLQQQPSAAEKKDEEAVTSPQPSAPITVQENDTISQNNLINTQTTGSPEVKPIVDTPVLNNAPLSTIVSMPGETPPAAPLDKPVVAEGEEIKSLEEEKIDEKVGIDTLNLPDPQGNWLYKSIWYERAQERYESIRKLVDLVWDFRGSFLEKRTELDRTVLDPFYISLGLRMGELQEVLSDLVSKFDVERKKDGDLNIQERSLLQEVKAEQLLIEKLHNQVKTVTELDHHVDDALDKLMEQLNKVRAYERDAWNNFKKISQLLSDTKARELYYAMDIQMRNIKDIQRYLQNEFRPYFQSTVDRIGEEIKTIQQSVERLKEQGVDFKTQADVLFQTIIHPLKKEPVLQKDGENADVTEEEEVVQKPGFFGRIMRWMSSIIEAVVYPFKALFGKIFT